MNDEKTMQPIPIPEMVWNRLVVLDRALAQAKQNFELCAITAMEALGLDPNEWALGQGGKFFVPRGELGGE